MSIVGQQLADRYNISLLRIPVPEWGDALPDGAVFARPFTESDASDLGGFIMRDDAEGFAETVLRHALAEDGSRLFDRGDKMVLVSGVESHVLRRIAFAIMTGDPDGVESALAMPPEEEASAEHDDPAEHENLGSEIAVGHENEHAG